MNRNRLLLLGLTYVTVGVAVLAVWWVSGERNPAFTIFMLIFGGVLAGGGVVSIIAGLRKPSRELVPPAPSSPSPTPSPSRAERPAPFDAGVPGTIGPVDLPTGGPPAAPLPHVDRSMLPIELVDASPEPPAPIREAVAASNAGDIDRAASVLEAALNEGLAPEFAAYAHSQLGQIELDRGRLDIGVDHLLRCLASPSLTAGTAWEAAARLQVLYEADGRLEEAERLARIASLANARDLALAHDYEERLRALVVDSAAGATPAPQPGPRAVVPVSTPRGGWPYHSVVREDTWTELGSELSRRGLTGTEPSGPRLYLLWATAEMAERVAAQRPAITQQLLAQSPEVMHFPDGSGAVALRLRNDRDFLKLVQALLEGRDYGERAVIQGLLAVDLPTGDENELRALLGAAEGISIGNVFIL